MQSPVEERNGRPWDYLPSIQVHCPTIYTISARFHIITVAIQPGRLTFVPGSFLQLIIMISMSTGV